MGLKGDDYGLTSYFPGGFLQPVDDLLVTEVNPVERADRNYRNIHPRKRIIISVYSHLFSIESAKLYIFSHHMIETRVTKPYPAGLTTVKAHV